MVGSFDLAPPEPDGHGYVSLVGRACSQSACPETASPLSRRPRFHHQTGFFGLVYERMCILGQDTGLPRRVRNLRYRQVAYALAQDQVPTNVLFPLASLPSAADCGTIQTRRTVTEKGICEL